MPYMVKQSREGIEAAQGSCQWWQSLGENPGPRSIPASSFWPVLLMLDPI